jgi:hypothetical protein
MLKTVRDRVKKQMDEGDGMGPIIASGPLSGFEKKGIGINDFVKIVYDSILKSGK